MTVYTINRQEIYGCTGCSSGARISFTDLRCAFKPDSYPDERQIRLRQHGTSFYLFHEHVAL